MAQTLGKYLVNDLLPKHLHTNDALGKKELTQRMLDLAKEDPSAYVEIVSNLKRLGDDISTLEGVSVGIDDITPQYKERNALIAATSAALKSARTQEEKEHVLLDAKAKMLAHTKQHPGTMTAMALDLLSK